MIINLIIGSCITLEGFTWSISALDKKRDLVKLSYPIVVRDEYGPKVTEKIEMRGSLWKLSYVQKSSSKTKCTKEYAK
jgi:hypothetical protein